MDLTSVFVISIVAFIILLLLIQLRQRKRRRNVEKELDMLIVAPTQSGRTTNRIAPIIQLAEASRRVLNGVSSPDDLPIWERALAEAQANGLMKDPAILEFKNDMFVKYLLLHYPDDKRLPDVFTENTSNAAEGVQANLVSIALWETYQRLCEAEYRAESWFTTFETYFDPDQSNEHVIVLKKDIDRQTLLLLLSESTYLLRQAQTNQQSAKWNQLTHKLLVRLKNFQSVRTVNVKEGGI
jgi:hypothetical protein